MDTIKELALENLDKNLKEAMQNFEEVGKIIITKEQKPRYVILNINDIASDLIDEEKVEIVARRILKENKHAFEVLGQ